MTARVHVTITKPHDAIVKLVMLDREGKQVDGTSAIFGTDCSEASECVTVFQDQSLWIGEGQLPDASGANARIAELEQISAERYKQLTEAQARIAELGQMNGLSAELAKSLSVAEARITELETQLAAKSSTKRSK
jgi:hypothetical protein